MAKKKDYSQEYAQALKRFNRRIKEWVTKHHMYVEAPKLTGPPSAKDVKALNKITLKNLTKSQVKEFQRNYDIAYDNNVEEVVDKPENIFDSIPNENDFNTDATLNQNEVKYKTEPAESDEEIMADLESLISGLLETAFRLAATPQETERAERRAVVFRQVFWDAVAKVGNKLAYLKYLEDSSTHMTLTEIVTRGLLDSQEKTYNSCFDDFATVLNIGRPITTEQSQDLTMYGRMGFDFSDTIYEG